jgi:hypothetical protein
MKRLVGAAVSLSTGAFIPANETHFINGSFYSYRG